MARLNWVPLHSIVVVRDNKQIDVYEQWKKDGKAFKFTQDEIDDIAATNNGSVEMSLRAPTDESVQDGTDLDKEVQTQGEIAAAETAASDKAAKAAKTPPAASDTPPAVTKGKDVDL